MIVYEGYEEQPLNPMDDQCCPNSDNFSAINVNNDDDSHIDSYCYDADASNDSADMNLSSSHEDSDHHHQHNKKNRSHAHDDEIDQHSHDQLIVNDDVSTDYHQRGYGEAAARGAAANKMSGNTSSAPFIPISEDTVFLDAVSGVGGSSSGGGRGGSGVGGGCSSSSSIPGIATSSPMSGDSWMNYSSNSSDDYSCLSEQLHSSVGADRTTISVNKSKSGKTLTTGDSTDASSSDFETSITESLPKRNFEHLLLRNNDEVKDKKDAMTMATSTPTKQIVVAGPSQQQQSTAKRQRGKDTKPNATTSTISINNNNNNNNKRRHSTISSLRRNSSVGSGSGSSAPLVDIRVIDFAHTAFVRKSGATSLSTSSTSVQHQGPDSGFLRGLDSLKRLLTEICAEDH